MEIGPLEMIELEELLTGLGVASAVAAEMGMKDAVGEARERVKELCQRGRARGPAAKWAGENGTRHLAREKRAVVSPILFDCRPVRLRGAGIQIYRGGN